MSDPGKAVFLSYASQDAEAAKRICDALRAAGVEVWFDAEGGLEHGDEWDAKIRRQIKDCVLFLPIISANTQAREEGYFRIEWELAAQRALGIASGVAFILPIVIDDTREPDALVPDRFRTVQWTKLPGGVVPSEVLQRFLKLWSHRTGLLKHKSEERGARSMEQEGRATPLQKSPRWLTPVVLAAGLAAAAVALWQPWKQDHAATADAAKPAARADVARPATPADKLVERANEILNSSALSRERIDTANGLLEQAMVLEPTHGAAWTAAARADLLLIHPYRFDRSTERRQRAMSRAARALNLAPDSFATRVVHTAVLAHASDNPALTKEAEDTFRRMIRERPDDQELQVQLGEVLREQERFAEAAALFEQIGVFELAGWSWFQAGRFADAYAPVKRAVVEHRTTTALSLKTRIEVDWFQDLSLAQATADQLRPSELQEGSGVVIVTELAFSRRDPERMLQILNALPRDFIETPAFEGPRQYYTGWAHRIAGRTERAKLEWRKAVAVLQTELTSAPGRVQLIVLEAEILALLGETAEAERMLATAQGIANEAPGTVGRGNIRVYLALGRKEPALSWLGSYLRARSDRSWAEVHAASRFSPVWDGLRGDPRFDALLRETKPEDAVPFDNPPPAVGLVAPDAKSVAVLAFANLSDDKGNEYFSDGISEELLNVLAKIPGLKVSARTSAFYFKGKEVPIPEIARQLGVAYVVEGSVRKQGDKVRITAQLIKAADGFHVWSDTFTRDLKDIFAVQDEIAALIAQNLQLKLDLAPVKRVVNPEAHRLVLEGRHYWLQRTDAAFARAQELYAKALEIDPEFAEAHAGIADVFVVRGWYHSLSGARVTATDYARAREEANISLRLDPTRPEPYASLAAVNFNEGRFADAEQSFKEALRLNPNYAVALHWRSHLLMAQGRPDEALASIERSIELDPFSSITLVIYANWLEHTGRDADALKVTERATALRTDQYLPLLGTRALVLWNLGRRDEAVAAARVVTHDPKQEPRWWVDGSVVYVLNQAGLVDEARAHLQNMLGELSVGSTARAALYAGMGDSERAIAELGLPGPGRRLAGPGETFYTTTWAVTRQDPRYAQLMEKLGRGEIYRRAQETLKRMKRDTK